MASIYDAVFPKLKRAPTERDEALEQRKQELAGSSATELAASYAGWRKVKAEIEKELAAANFQLEAVEALLIDSEEADVEEWGAYGASPNTLRRANGDKIEVRTEISVRALDHDTVREWFKEQGLERMLTVNASTLAGHVKKMLLSGDPEPPGTEATTWKKIHFTPMEKK